MRDPSGAVTTGIGQTVLGSGTIVAEEYDYAPGFKDDRPLGYVNTAGAAGTDFIFLTHPTTNAFGTLPFPLTSYVRLMDSDPGNCVGPNGYNETSTPVFVGLGAQFLTPNSNVQPFSLKPFPSPYSGIIYDCGLAPFLPFRKGLEATSDITIYPNPTVKDIRLNGDLSAFHSVRILDQTGREVLKSTHLTEKLTVEALPAGVYHLNLIGQEQTETRTFVKQ
ncbi:MAG: T9SS type A sorting domain-containing protein [Bacteroidota bacterium]